MKSRANFSFLICISLLLVTNALHLNQTNNTELLQLKEEQGYLSDTVKDILSNSASVNDQLQNATTDKQKVEILESALASQRDQVFKLRNKIIYPFNESQTACKQLTDKQKISLLDKIQITKKQLNSLQQINNKLDANIVKVQNVGHIIQKQFILLQQMEEILKVKCKENLSPTIFQSNLNAKNWILGPQNMNDLEQQYSQRALIFHNITNCPFQSPFYSPNLQICIKCEQPTPVFNIYSKQCTKCEGDEQVDADKKICKSRPHYTNYSKLQNWNLDGGNIPEVDKNLTPCPDLKPYFNGIVCISCDLPYYWSVSANLCKQCQKGNIFDLNTKKCQKIVINQLTILQNTKWISDNLTKVVQDRVKILQKNKTKTIYQYCPDQSNPFYDQTTCIFCDYFNMDTSKCVKKPEGTQYDNNMRKFIVPQQNKQTNPTVKRYITANKLTDSSVPNCNDTFPFYDGIACVQCLPPFDIFNLDEKKCVLCDSDQIFVQSLRICQKRKKIMVSDNFNRLLATTKVTVPKYKQSLIKTINDNPDFIIYPCPQKNQYSNLSDCYLCQDNEYFNVETFNCQVCDGIYSDINQTCKQKVYIFTNVKAAKIVDMDGTTVENQNKKISEFLKTRPQSYVCPLDKPYAIQNKTCGTCPDLFSYSQLKCKSCPQWNIYVADERKCLQAKMIVDFTDDHKILVSQEQTLPSFKDKEQIVKNQNPKTWKVCPVDRPYTQNRDFCFNCTENSPYFNYTIKQCQGCPDHYVFDSKTVRCVEQFFITLINSDTQPRMFGYENYTMQKYRAEQQLFKKSHPYVICKESQPFGTPTGCRQCNQPTMYFDIKKKDCSEVKYLINFQKINPQYILPKDKNIDIFIAEEQKFRKQALFLTKKCPDATPYTNDRGSCFNCSSQEYFKFETRKCQKCPDDQAYVKQLKNCQQLFYVTKITSVTQPNMKGYLNYTMENYKKEQADIKANNPFKQCPQNSPYGTISGCQQCQQLNPYFDIKKKICSAAKKLINFNATGQNYILADGKTLITYQDAQKNYKVYSESLTVDCPKQTPFTSDRDYCFVCKEPDYLFNFETKKCESCPRGTQFSNEKKKCLRLFYITYFTTETQKKMLGTSDYTIANFKIDQEKLKKQNPFIDCNATDPYGTLDGCRKCLAPEQYFDVKDKACTAVKRLINFASIDKNYILKQGKTLADYTKDQKSYQASSELPTLVCPPQAPYTSTRDVCLACKDPEILFNLQTKICQKCQATQAYDLISKRCAVKQFYTLFSPTSQKSLLQTDNYTLAQYKDSQNKIKTTAGSIQCTAEKPYATDTGCIQCNGTAPQFNINTKTCQACETGKVYFQTLRKCLTAAYMTNFDNKNIKETADFTKTDAKKIQQERAARAGYTAVKCTSDKSFATLDGCVACNDTKKPYFNIKTQVCQGCKVFYQYFLDNKCQDYTIMTNTKGMVGYIEVHNYTKYNVEKKNNYTYVKKYPYAIDCPKDTPFYFRSQDICVDCNTPDKPVFSLELQQCVQVNGSIKESNVDAMKFYIEKPQFKLADIKSQIDALKSKGVAIQTCPAQKPYLSNNKCIMCPEQTKYFDLAFQMCKVCGTGETCISV